MTKILVADDDAALRGLLRLVAARAGFDVDTANNGAEALDRLQSTTYDIALIDLMMPRVSGYEVIEQIARMDRRPVVVVVTAMNDTHLRRLDGQVVTSILRKPFDIESLSEVLVEIARALEDNRSATATNVVDFPASRSNYRAV